MKIGKYIEEITCYSVKFLQGMKNKSLAEHLVMNTNIVKIK